MNFQIDPALRGDENMRRDSALLEASERGEAGCRVYTWSEPWVTLGQFQSPERDLVDPSLVGWTIRPTGGKAVLHGHDITVGMAAPLELLGVGNRSLKSAYREVIRPIVVALNACGLACALGEDTRHLSHGQRTADCFAFKSANDVLSLETGRKVCGCALRMTESSVLLQASIPYKAPLVDPCSVIRGALRGDVSHEWDPVDFAEQIRRALLPG